MRFRYDPEADVLYIRFDESRIVESGEVKPGIVLDVGELKRLVA